MDAVRELVTQIFDFELPDETIRERFITNSCLNVRAVLSHPLLMASLTFRRAFRAVMKTHASFGLTNKFLVKLGVDSVGEVSRDAFVDAVRAACPAFGALFPKFISPEAIDRELQSAKAYLACQGQLHIRRDIVCKFAERFLGSAEFAQDVVQQVEEGKMNVLQAYGIVKARGAETALTITDMQRNPFSGYVNLAAACNEDFGAPLDTVADLLAADGAFFLKLLGAHAVYPTSGRIDAVCECALRAIDAERPPNDTIVVFVREEDHKHRSRLPFNVHTVVLPADNSRAALKLFSLLPRICASFVCVTDDADAATVPPPLCTNVVACTLVTTLSLAPYAQLTSTYGRQAVVPRPHRPSASPFGAPHRDPAFVETMLRRKIFGHPSDPGLLFYDFVAMYCANHLDGALLPLSMTLNQLHSSKNAHAIVVVDNRANIMNVVAARVTALNLARSSAHSWDTIVFTRDDASDKEFYSERLPGAKIVALDAIPQQRRFSMQFYNELLKSREFWEQLQDYERVLLVQDDGFVIRTGDIDAFLKFDYVGAPWDPAAPYNTYMRDSEHHRISPNYVGNGGLSLRNPRAMLELCGRQDDDAGARALHFDGLQPEPEDVFFAKMCLRHNKLLPTFEEAKRFSSEEVLCMESLGFHKVWGYHSPDRVKAFFHSAAAKSSTTTPA